MRKIAFSLLFILLTSSVSYATESYSITEDQAIRAIIGEDSSSYEGMNAVAHAIRNRGHLKGVYGLRAVRWSDGVLQRFKADGTVVETISPELYQSASRAWFESEDEIDPTHGATHWEGAKYKNPYWTEGMINLGQFGENIFYREKA